MTDREAMIEVIDSVNRENIGKPTDANVYADHLIESGFGRVEKECPSCKVAHSIVDIWCPKCGYGIFGNYIWRDGLPHLHREGYE